MQFFSNVALVTSFATESIAGFKNMNQSLYALSVLMHLVLDFTYIILYSLNIIQALS